MNKERPIVLSLGGSLIFPDEIDVDFVRGFKELLKKHIGEGRRFVVITGGGKICRKYQAAAEEITPELTHEDGDWIGIHTTRMNGRFIQYVFKGFASEQMIGDPDHVQDDGSPVLVGAGWEPGWSSDYDAVKAALSVGATKMVNLSNVTHVYSADPKKDPGAEKLSALSWAEYRSLIPSEWQPGLNTPFDPKAAELAEQHGLEVVIMGGNLTNLAQYLDKKQFEGTTIS